MMDFTIPHTMEIEHEELQKERGLAAKQEKQQRN